MYNVLDRGVNMIEYTKNQVHEVACAFNEHKIIALPTDTVYGVGVKYGNLDDLERLKRAKHRPETKPIPMMVSNIEQMKTSCFSWMKESKRLPLSFCQAH